MERRNFERQAKHSRNDEKLLKSELLLGAEEHGARSGRDRPRNKSPVGEIYGRTNNKSVSSSQVVLANGRQRMVIKYLVSHEVDKMIKEA